MLAQRWESSVVPPAPRRPLLRHRPLLWHPRPNRLPRQPPLRLAAPQRPPLPRLLRPPLRRLRLAANRMRARSFANLLGNRGLIFRPWCRVRRTDGSPKPMSKPLPAVLPLPRLLHQHPPLPPPHHKPLLHRKPHNQQLLKLLRHRLLRKRRRPPRQRDPQHLLALRLGTAVMPGIGLSR